MANYLDTGDTGRAVSAESDGALFAGIFGNAKYVMENGSQFKAEVQSNNIVKISDGDAVMYGRHVRIPANDSALVTINNGHSGTNRIDLIVFRYTKDSTGKETVDLAVIQGEDSTGTAAAPATIDGDILTGAMQADFPLYRVELNGLNIVSVTAMFDVIGNISQITKKNKDLSNRIAESFKCELTQLTTKAFRAAPKATVMRLDKQYDYSDFKMIGFCIINMSTSDSVTHRQWQWLPTRWLQDNLLNQSSSSSYANRRLIFNFSRGGGGQRAWIYGSTNDGLNFIKGSDDTDNYDCAIFGLR